MSARRNWAARTAQPSGNDGIPIVLPRLVFRAQHADVFILTVDGIDNVDGADSELCQRAVRRAELGTTIAQLAGRAGSAVRIEIYEHDGTTHADIVEPPPNTGTSQARGSFDPEGFLAGEPVLIAVVVQTVNADRRGRLSLPLAPPSAGPPPAGRYVLVGGISHHVAIQRRH